LRISEAVPGFGFRARGAQAVDVFVQIRLSASRHQENRPGLGSARISDGALAAGTKIRPYSTMTWSGLDNYEALWWADGGPW
jgi:hypothetical protein